MMIQPNDGGGTTVLIANGDSLEDVPDTHADIITPEIREAFIDPAAYFRTIADSTTLPSFGRYLRGLTDVGRWTLLLADTYMMERDTIGAFHWIHPDQLPSMIAPGPAVAPREDFAVLYSDVRLVHWGSIASSGGIFPASEHIVLDDYGIPSNNPLFDPNSTFVFGNSSCGDVMVYHSNGHAGYLSHENGQSYVVGTISEILDWMFSELLENRSPEFDYDRC